MMTRLASEPMHQIETAEELEAGGHPDRARDHLIGLVDTVDSSSDVRSIRRCLDLATRIGARDLALHYALCFWCGWPGHNGAKHALAGAALFHPDRRVAGAGYRICLRRTRTSDWCAIATADDYATWPQIHNLLGPDRHRARTIVQLSDAHLIRPIGPDGTGVWLLGPARVTRAGRSLAVGVDDGGSGDSASYVPGLSVWDPSAALRWGAPPRREAYDRLGLLATQFLYSGYWHWLMEGLLHAVRLDEAGVLQALDRLVICIDGREARLVSESLQAVGIRLTAVELSSTPFDCYARELVVPMRAPGFGGLVDEADPSDFREILLQNTKYHNGADIRAARRRLGLEGAAAPRIAAIVRISTRCREATRGQRGRTPHSTCDVGLRGDRSRRADLRGAGGRVLLSRRRRGSTRRRARKRDLHASRQHDRGAPPRRLRTDPLRAARRTGWAPLPRPCVRPRRDVASGHGGRRRRGGCSDSRPAGQPIAARGRSGLRRPGVRPEGNPPTTGVGVVR
jgi:hypothetical protein